MGVRAACWGIARRREYWWGSLKSSGTAQLIQIELVTISNPKMPSSICAALLRDQPLYEMASFDLQYVSSDNGLQKNDKELSGMLLVLPAPTNAPEICSVM